MTTTPTDAERLRVLESIADRMCELLGEATCLWEFEPEAQDWERAAREVTNDWCDWKHEQTE